MTGLLLFAINLSHPRGHSYDCQRSTPSVHSERVVGHLLCRKDRRTARERLGKPVLTANQASVWEAPTWLGGRFGILAAGEPADRILHVQPDQFERVHLVTAS